MDSTINHLGVLEITVISAENLSDSNGRPIKSNAYAVVRTDAQTYASTKASTEGSSNPCWKEKLTVELPKHAPFITIQVYSKASLLVGTARVPVSDFIGGSFPETFLHCLSYRLRDANGQRNGIVNFSVRLKVPSTSRPSCFAASQVAGAIPTWHNCYA